MPTPRAFISFDFDHNENQRTLFVGQAKNAKVPFSMEDWSSKLPLPQSQWEAQLKLKINKCHFMVVLVGRTMATATGVSKEITMAKEQNVPFFGVYVDGAGPQSTLPIGLARDRTIKWDWDAVKGAVATMMTEGKNR